MIILIIVYSNGQIIYIIFQNTQTFVDARVMFSMYDMLYNIVYRHARHV